MSRYDVLLSHEPAPKPKATKPTKPPRPKAPSQPVSPPVVRPVGQPASPLAVRRTAPIVEKSFYIPERLHKRIDEAVRYFQDVHGLRKADRSTVVSAMLDNEANWSSESLDLLVDRVLSQLASRLTD